MESRGVDRRGDPAGIDYIRLACEFAPELAAGAGAIGHRRELPEAVRATLIERGFFRMLLPRSPGGRARTVQPTPYFLNQVNILHQPSLAASGR